MIELPTNPPVWVADSILLNKMLADLCTQPVVAVDTESNSMYAYQEQVCLIQFSSPTADYLVDPLTGPDLSGLGRLFADASIRKVFHAAEYDLICLKRDYGFTFRNIFDTMQAARVLGRTEVGLAAVLNAEFGIELDKRYQRDNWGIRPLPTAMLAYARLDTHFLIALQEKLEAALVEMGRWEMAVEDFARLAAMDVQTEPNPAALCWKVMGSRDLSPQQAAVLQELCNYRDEQARHRDLPHFKVLGNDTLLEIARVCPQNQEELSQLNISPKLIQRHGMRLLQAVQRGLEAPPLHRKPNPRPAEDYINRLDMLKTWRKERGREMGVESDVILPREVLETIAHVNPRQHSELADVMKFLPWRLKNYGNEILSLLQA